MRNNLHEIDQKVEAELGEEEYMFADGCEIEWSKLRRDLNAAKQINNVGVGHTHDRINKRTQRKSKTVQAVISNEASTHKVEWERLRLPI